MQSYVEEQGPFNVIGVYRAEFDKRTVKILSPNNSLAYAQHMVNLIKGELATKQICGEGGKVMVDAYLEPAGCPRPLSPELQAMMHRETARRAIEDVAHNKTAESQRQIREERVARIRFWTSFAIITTALLIQSTIHSCTPTVPSTSVFDVWAMQQEAERRAGR